MLEHTKMLPTEILQVHCPLAAYADVMRALQDYGCTVEDAVPIEDVLDMRVGTILKGARYREELTQIALAQKTGIPRRHISDMENDRRPIGKGNAKKLAEALHTNYKVFL